MYREFFLAICSVYNGSYKALRSHLKGTLKLIVLYNFLQIQNFQPHRLAYIKNTGIALRFWVLGKRVFNFSKVSIDLFKSYSFSL